MIASGTRRHDHARTGLHFSRVAIPDELGVFDDHVRPSTRPSAAPSLARSTQIRRRDPFDTITTRFGESLPRATACREHTAHDKTCVIRACGIHLTM